MRSARVVLLALVAVLVGLAAAAAAVVLVGESDDGGPPETGGAGTNEPLSGPEVRFGGTDVTTGAALGLGKLEGRPVVVTVWASWCSACPRQAEPLRRFAAAHENTALLGVATQEDAESARDFLAANDLEVPTIADQDGHVAAKLGVRELPTTLFLTSDHRVATMWEGPADFRELEDGLAAARRIGS